MISNEIREDEEIEARETFGEERKGEGGKESDGRKGKGAGEERGGEKERRWKRTEITRRFGAERVPSPEHKAA